MRNPNPEIREYQCQTCDTTLNEFEESCWGCDLWEFLHTDFTPEELEFIKTRIIYEANND